MSTPHCFCDYNAGQVKCIYPAPTDCTTPAWAVDVSLKNLSDQKVDTASLCTFATSQKASDMTNGAGFLTSATGVCKIDFTGVPCCGNITLASVATSCKTSDLCNIPVIFFTASTIVGGAAGKIQFNNAVGAACGFGGAVVTYGGDNLQSIVEGGGVVDAATGFCSHAEGSGVVFGQRNHAEGSGYAGTVSTPGCVNHAEGFCTCVGQCASHAEGFCSFISDISSNYGSHAEGFCACSINCSVTHTEGFCTLANAACSHAEGAAIGYGTIPVCRYPTAAGCGSHAEGIGTYATAPYAHAEGVAVPNTDPANPLIVGGYSSCQASHVEGVGSCACNVAAHAEGFCTCAAGCMSHSEGFCTRACGCGSHAEGNCRCACGSSACACVFNVASGHGSHAEGMGTCAAGLGSHAEGYAASNDDPASPVLYPVCAGSCGSHAEGGGTCALNGVGAHAEGYRTCSMGIGSHSEGFCTVVFDASGTGANGMASHAEGFCNVTTSCRSHAEGCCNIIGDPASHIEGFCNFILGCTGIANHAEGCCNYIHCANCGSHTEGFCNAIGLAGWADHIEGFCGLICGNGVGGFCGVHVEGAGNIAAAHLAHVEGACFCPTNAVVNESTCQVNATTGNVSFGSICHYPVATPCFLGNLAYGAVVGCVLCGAANPPTTVSQCFCIDGTGTLSVMFNCGTPCTCICQNTVVNALNLTTGAWGNIPMCGSSGNTALSYCYYVVPTLVFNTVTGFVGHAEGMGTCATSCFSHAEGVAAPCSIVGTDLCGTNCTTPVPTCASGIASHAEGGGTSAAGFASHAEGYMTSTSQFGSHVAGYRNCIGTTAGCASHVHGFCNVLGSGVNAIVAGHVEGGCNVYGNACYSHMEGFCNYLCDGAHYSHVEGCCNVASPNAMVAHIEGYANCVDASQAHAEGCCTYAGGIAAHAEGGCTRAGASATHAEGGCTCACANTSHVEGYGTLSCGIAGHAEGFCTIACCNYSHAEGFCTIACGVAAHAEGVASQAVATGAHAEGCAACACQIGQHAAAGGVVGIMSLTSIGNAQYSRFHLYGSTTGAASTELSIGGASFITLPAYTTLMFTAKIVAKISGASGATAVWFKRGVITRNAAASSTAIVNSVTSEYGDGAWNNMGGGALSIDATNDGVIGRLRIQGTGASGTTHWSAVIECAEVINK